jgi:prevent-host-death family protein
MAQTTMPATISASTARSKLASLLRQASQKKRRFLITQKGEPTAVLLGVTDLDDMLEELDPEFQKSLKIAAQEYRSGKVTPLREYRGKRAKHRPG